MQSHFQAVKPLDYEGRDRKGGLSQWSHPQSDSNWHGSLPHNKKDYRLENRAFCLEWIARAFCRNLLFAELILRCLVMD